MSNLKINKINNIDVNDGLVRNYGRIDGGSLVMQCIETGLYRVYNATTGTPPNTQSGNSDFFVSTIKAPERKWIRLEVFNIRNEDCWRIINFEGEWGEWELVPTGDMKKLIFDPNNIAKDVYSRTNHTGKQAISTIEGLEEQLASKSDATPATVDTLNVDSLSNQYCYMPSSANITGTLPINITNLDYEKQYVFTSTSSDKYIHNRIDSCVDGNSWVRGYAKARGKFEDWEQIITNKVQRLPSNINIDTEFKNYTTNYSGNIVNVSLGTLPAGLMASNNFIMLSGTVVSNTQRQEIKDLNSINTWTRFWNGYKWSDWYLVLTERAVK